MTEEEAEQKAYETLTLAKVPRSGRWREWLREKLGW